VSIRDIQFGGGTLFVPLRPSRAISTFYVGRRIRDRSPRNQNGNETLKHRLSPLIAQEDSEAKDSSVTSVHQLLSYLVRVRNLLRDFNPEIVHAHMVPGAITGHLLRYGSHYKMITSVHNSGRFGTRLMSLGDLVVCVSNYLASEVCRRGGRPENCASCTTAHWDHRDCRRCRPLVIVCSDRPSSRLRSPQHTKAWAT